MGEISEFFSENRKIWLFWQCLKAQALLGQLTKIEKFNPGVAP
jgi:hypothetical protein